MRKLRINVATASAYTTCAGIILTFVAFQSHRVGTVYNKKKKKIKNDIFEVNVQILLVLKVFHFSGVARAA